MAILLFGLIALASNLFSAGVVGVPAQTAQPPAEDKRFDVASVKPALSPAELGAQAARATANGQPPPPPRFGVQTDPGGRFTAYSSLRQLIANAYDVKDFQIDGGPKWLASDYFQIVANAGADATPVDVRSMLRNLLTERFALRTHSETRQLPQFVLTVARSDGRLGSQLTRPSPDCVKQIEERKNGKATQTIPPPPPNVRELPPRPRCGLASFVSRANGAMTALFGGMELTSLVSQISNELSAPVVDRTELTGLFDITLEYLSERRIAGRASGLDPNSTDSPPPTLTAALQQQLGLKLERQIGPLPIVVVDAAEPPTPD